jgi:hypothetical protein
VKKKTKIRNLINIKMSNRDRTPSPKKYTTQTLIKNGAVFDAPSKQHIQLNINSVIEAIQKIDQEEKKIMSPKTTNHKRIGSYPLAPCRKTGKWEWSTE